MKVLVHPQRVELYVRAYKARPQNRRGQDAYIGGGGRYRTVVLWFFRPALRPPKLPFQMVGMTGVEPA